MNEWVVFVDKNQVVQIAPPSAHELVSVDEVGFVAVLDDDPSLVVEQLRSDQVVSEGSQGPPGPQGPPGAGGNSALPTVSYIAGETLGGHRAVHISGGQALYASNNDTSADSVFGITLGAATLGASVQIRYVGPIEEPSWSWTPGEPIYLGTNGMLTQTPPISGALVELGIALTATSISVRIQEAVYLN